MSESAAMKRCVCGYLPLPDATHCPRCGKRIETTACIFPRCVDGEKPSHCGNCEGRETPYAHEYDRSAAKIDHEANPTVQGQGRTLGGEANPGDGRVYGALARLAAMQAGHPEWWMVTAWPE